MSLEGSTSDPFHFARENTTTSETSLTVNLVHFAAKDVKPKGRKVFAQDLGEACGENRAACKGHSVQCQGLSPAKAVSDLGFKYFTLYKNYC